MFSHIMGRLLLPSWTPSLLLNIHTYINTYLPSRRGTGDAEEGIFDLLVMLGMLAGHAGDVENDADDVDGLV